MDPIYLKSEEVDYELMIRNVYDLQVSMRTKTGRLRELLNRESIDSSLYPKKGTSPFPPKEDLQMCSNICRELREQLSNTTLNEVERWMILSRAIHVGNRLQRIQGGELSIVDQLAEYESVAESILRKIQADLGPGGQSVSNKAPRASVSFALPVTQEDGIEAGMSQEVSRHSLPASNNSQQELFQGDWRNSTHASTNAQQAECGSTNS